VLRRRYRPQKGSHVDHVVAFKYDVNVPESAPNVIGYLRVSTREQKDEGVSPQRGGAWHAAQVRQLLLMAKIGAEV